MPDDQLPRQGSGSGPALEKREQFTSHIPQTGIGANVQEGVGSYERIGSTNHDQLASPMLTDGAGSPFASSSSQPHTPPVLLQSAIAGDNMASADKTNNAANDFHPATLAQKLAAHEANITGPKSGPGSAVPSTPGGISNRATPGTWTPRSEFGSEMGSQSPVVQDSHHPAAAATPSQPSSRLAVSTPLNGEGSSDSSAFSSRVSTMASNADASPMLPQPSESAPGKAIPLTGFFDEVNAGSAPQKEKEKTTASPQQLPSNALLPGPANNQPRTGSPAKPRPAVFSAIPPKDKDAVKDAAREKQSSPLLEAGGPPPAARPPMQEKRSAIGKMFSAMRSSDKLPSTNKHEGKHDVNNDAPNRARGTSSASQADVDRGIESDSSAAGSESQFAKISRKLSGGSKQREKEREAFRKEQAQLQQQPQLVSNAEGLPAKPPTNRTPSRGGKDEVSRRPSVKENKGESGMAHSFKDFMERAPLMHRKSSVTSRKSDDGKSEKGSEYDAKASTAGDSLMKKYGACEKVAIGKGATAVVRLAHKWDKTSEKLYAVKEFRKRRKNETEKDYVKKLTSEFCISSTLHHPNVVETVDLVQDENHHWCEVMEYCPNGDLYAAIKRGDLSTERINTYFQQMLSGVAYLHSMGVAHRDIKPENLLLDGNDVIKITDFGVSDVFRMCWEKTTHMSKGLCGSEPYIAPEQFEPKAQYDARLVDVWACAVVYYCMQFQELPWRVAKMSDPSYSAFVEAYSHSSAPPPLGDLTPRECRPVVKGMLNPNPKYRYDTAAIFKDPFIASLMPQSAAGGSGTPASPAGSALKPVASKLPSVEASKALEIAAPTSNATGAR